MTTLAEKVKNLKPAEQELLKRRLRGEVTNLEAAGIGVANCHEAHTQGRWRERDLEKITDSAERAVRRQGAKDVGFYSLTWSLHSQVYSLLLWNYERFGESSLISQRADQASADPNFFKFQNVQGQKSTTIGVEGVSQRMRNYYNKSLSREQLLRSIENAARGGMTALKLFMILSGLETKEDVEEFCEDLKEISRRGKRIAKELTESEGVSRQPIRMNPSFMLLLNMPHSALQWAPCAASFDLHTDIARRIVETAKQLSFGFRTSLTRDRVRISNWVAMLGREATTFLMEAGLRCNFMYYGPIAKRLTWYVDRAGFEKWGIGKLPESEKEAVEKMVDDLVSSREVPVKWKSYFQENLGKKWEDDFKSLEITSTMVEQWKKDLWDHRQAEHSWMYWFREKDWDTILPNDGIQTPMRRDYLWNQWLRLREYQGVAYCLKTSVNLNPRCHDCGACDPIDEDGPKQGQAKKKMLTRKLEDSTRLVGQEASRKDMTVRSVVRWKVNIFDPFYRNAPKNILARSITRAMMIALEKREYHHPMIRAYLRVDGHSLKWPEGQGALPWVCGEVLIDHVFNQRWDEHLLRDIIPEMNEELGRQGTRIEDFVVSDKLPSFTKETYGLYTCTMNDLSFHDAKEGIGLLGLGGVYEHKKKVAAGKGAFKSVTEMKTREKTIPMVLPQMTDEGTKVTYLASLEVNPITALSQILKRRKVGLLKPHPIWCLGYFKYDRQRDNAESDTFDDGDIFAALAGQELFCEITGDPIETDLFNGELYRSTTAPNLCLAADLANMKERSDLGVGTGMVLGQD